MREGPVRPPGVVDVDERVQEGLQLAEGGGLLRLSAEPLLQGLLEAFSIALGLRVVRLAVLLRDVAFVELVLEVVTTRGATPNSRTVNTRLLSVSVEAGKPCVAAASQQKVVSRIGSVTGRCAVTDRA